MNQRDELIEIYAEDLKTKCGQEPDMEFLRKVTVALGPSIYNADSSVVSSSDPSEVATVKNNFLIGKLGLADGPDLDAGLDAVFETYGRSNRHKYRAVVYYLLAKHFGKEAIYG
ncbi:MAG: DUF2853 family protein [Pikeienuella sp.]